ncbi:hypothetical protein [Evansella cellulosilytica]|uniref:Uncharacterized protein n=1 Tax=Evansella cellulosilytica (strain ATCC 21833 / DSM 2522 / FERM P-1141 / JCM 9156 / N-4) TaxID=649639 RepID=E6TRR4_EVAC2|nr:hypothetical protein [Evansella cellulosilytica]ADU29437.1 hypothetical protein Bcell_1172 [Evansella cellulosilytica DSM 2522]
MVFILMIIFMLPFLILLWQQHYVKEGKREKVNVKFALLLFSLLFLASLIGQIYFLMQYDLPLYVTGEQYLIGLLMVAFSLGLIAIINIGVTIWSKKKNMPKGAYNSKLVWKVTGGIGVIVLLFIFWFMPFAEKASYVLAFHNAVDAVAQADEEEEFSIVLVRSERDCVRRCAGRKYDNHFYISNNSEGKKEVEFLIRALDEEQNELKVIESSLMRTDPGEILLLETEETNTDSNVWNRYSFQTDDAVYYFQYDYHYRNAE